LVATWTLRRISARPPPCGPVRERAQEVAAKPDEGSNSAGQNALAGLDRVHARLARRLEAELFGKPVQRHEFGLLGDADGALALYVRVPAHGDTPVPSRPMFPLSKSRFTSIATLSKPWACCVSPIPNTPMTRSAST
jgi:hypothetical protein